MSKATTNHKTIREWAERQGGKPASVDRTHHGDDVGIIRIMFPTSPRSEHQHLVEISWEEFFDQFEESSLALLYEEDSRFSKLVGRDTAEHRSVGDNDASRRENRSENRRVSGRETRANDESSSRSASEGRDERTNETADLRSREYRDKDGNVHHHTHPYMRSHEKS